VGCRSTVQKKRLHHSSWVTLLAFCFVDYCLSMFVIITDEGHMGLNHMCIYGIVYNYEGERQTFTTEVLDEELSDSA
jgi:hypothetical protein